MNSVGVDVNTASAPLLARVSGLERRRWPRTSSRCRDEQRRLQDRAAAARRRCRASGPRPSSRRPASCASRRRATRSTASAVHPETYPRGRAIVRDDQASAEVADRRHARSCARSKPDAVRRRARSACRPSRDILAELEKPGRDPRPEFKTAALQRRRREDRGPAAGHGARRRGHQRHGVRRLRRRRRAPGRPGARLASWPTVRQGSARGGEGRRHREGAGAWRSTWRASASR